MDNLKTSCFIIGENLTTLVDLVCEKYQMLISNDSGVFNTFMEAYTKISAALNTLKTAFTTESPLKQGAFTLINWVEDFYNYIQQVVNAMNNPHEEVTMYLNQQVNEIEAYIIAFVAQLSEDNIEHMETPIPQNSDHTPIDETGNDPAIDIIDISADIETLDFSHQNSFDSDGSKEINRRSHSHSTQPTQKDIQPQQRSISEGSAVSRTSVLDTIIKGEKTYVNYLDKAIKYYIQPLQQEAKRKKGLITDTEFVTIFGGLEIICQINRQFLVDLEAKRQDQSDLGEIFKKFALSLKLYTTYINNRDQSHQLLRELTKKSKKFESFVEELKEKCGSEMELEQYLALPVERLPTYQEELQRLVQATPYNFPDFKALQAAQETFKQVSDEIRKKKEKRAIEAKSSPYRNKFLVFLVI